MMYRSCDSDEVHFSDIQPSDGFTAGYLRRHQNKKCFKRPCTFDAFTSQPLKKARYEKGIGCVCDPALGQFGVRIEGLSDYVRGPGYNACASVFQTPLEKTHSRASGHLFLFDATACRQLFTIRQHSGFPGHCCPLFFHSRGNVANGSRISVRLHASLFQTTTPFYGSSAPV
ncbi:uncharacterized protein TNCT_125931 [Trichonephila clavata]|uniref:Uncharacterized protein n=1 Tax=Trichonephila clavata TaxID=2740835 RepID=A0A8X6KK79_TRICU|nr:uncharacterized protein TNCT_125931 [Trichonephila clavata]